MVTDAQAEFEPLNQEELAAQGAAWPVITTYPSSPDGRTFLWSRVSLLRLAQGRRKELRLPSQLWVHIQPSARVSSGSLGRRLNLPEP